MINLGKRSRLSLVGLAAALVTMALVFATPGTASATKAGWSPIVAKNELGMMKSRVFGTTEDGRKVKGTFTPSAVEVVGETLMVDGTLDYAIVGKGKPLTGSEDISLPVSDISSPGGSTLGSGARGMAATAVGSCDILNLELGPLDLDLLGLQVHLDKVVLDIVAQAGAGNLLGNLLCAVAGLLDQGGPLSGLLDQLIGVLQDILDALGLLGL